MTRKPYLLPRKYPVQGQKNTNVTLADMQAVCEKAAKAICGSGRSCDLSNMAIDKKGSSACVFREAYTRDVYGWVLKTAYDHYKRQYPTAPKASAERFAYHMAMLVDSQIRVHTKGELWLVGLGFFSPSKAAKTLLTAGSSADALPTLFHYGR